MPDIDFGAFATGAVGSFTQARDYNLAVAQARQSASMRMRQIELQEERAELERERVTQAIAKSKIEEEAAREGLKAQVRETKLKAAGERFISQAKTLGAMREKETPSGKKPWAAEAIPEISPSRLEAKYGEAGLVAPRTVTVAAEEEAMTPHARKVRDLELEKLEKEVKTGGKLTQTQEFWRQYWDPNTPEEQRDKLSIMLFGKPDKTATVDGVSTVDVRRILDTLYPVNRFGDREGVPENVDPHSYEFLRHGAQLAKGILGGGEVDLGIIGAEPDTTYNKFLKVK